MKEFWSSRIRDAGALYRRGSSPGTGSSSSSTPTRTPIRPPPRCWRPSAPQRMRHLRLYPDPECAGAAARPSRRRYGLSVDQVFCGQRLRRGAGLRLSGLFRPGPRGGLSPTLPTAFTRCTPSYFGLQVPAGAPGRGLLLAPVDVLSRATTAGWCLPTPTPPPAWP